ncbi:MAG: FMN-binding protein [Eubacteriaceae bacterium]
MKRRIIYITLILVTLTFIFLGCGAKGKWNEGEYQGVSEGMHGEMSVKVIISDGKISNIEVISQNETAGVGDVAIDKIPLEIINAQSTEVEAISGASESSKAIISAVNDALQKAAK